MKPGTFVHQSGMATTGLRDHDKPASTERSDDFDEDALSATGLPTDS